MTFAVLMLFMVAATALYGPQAAALVELFPTRVRYTAMSLPYNIGTGWVGGLLPAASFALVAASGNIYFGLWYSVRLHRGGGAGHPDLAAGNQGPGPEHDRRLKRSDPCDVSSRTRIG